MGGPSTRWKVGLCCCWRKGWDVKQKMWTAINKKQLWVVFRPFLRVDVCLNPISMSELPGKHWKSGWLNLRIEALASRKVLKHESQSKSSTDSCRVGSWRWNNSCCKDPHVHGEFTWYDAKFHATTKVQSQHVFKGKLGFPFGKEFSPILTKLPFRSEWRISMKSRVECIIYTLPKTNSWHLGPGRPFEKNKFIFQPQYFIWELLLMEQILHDLKCIKPCK